MPKTGDVVMRVTESQFEWNIENFSLSKHNYWSPVFNFDGESWWLEVFQYLDDAQLPAVVDGYINLRLWRSSSGLPVEVEFIVALKTIKGRKCFERRERKCFEGLTSYISFERLRCLNIIQWIERSEFSKRQTEFLLSGCLTIILTMKKSESGESQNEKDTSQRSESQLKDKTLHDFKQLLLNHENCDVVLRVQGQEFSAHQAILVARSPVFASTFRSNMKEKETGTVNIEDVDPNCFPEFLCFLYCDELDKLSVENVSSLFSTADKYQIMDLRTTCLAFMKENVCVNTFCETVALALLHSETELINACTDYFVRNAEKIIETVQWQTFVAENPIQSNELFIKYVKSTNKSNK